MAKTAADTLLRHWALLRKIPRYPQTKTASALHRALAEEGYSVELRTVQRDLQWLRDIFPIDRDDSRPAHGWYWAKHAARLDVPGMEPATALAFCLVRQ
jgi:hypothetical protein